ncbi:MAG: hypothetical protein NNA24_12685 [Nitrospira sp.]|nr:hypothetical protein [Nitrospira sp.]
MYRMPLAWSLVACCFLPAAAFAEPRSGTVSWDKWNFEWAVYDNQSLILTDVSYDGEPVLAKASLPVIRVKYEREWPWYHPYSWFGMGRSTGRCGPFQDRITWKHLETVPSCNSKVCIRPYTIGGVKWLEIGVYARIGEYHLYHAWYLNELGEIRPVLQSRGLSCRTTHIHHPYWRFDFGAAGADGEQVFEYTDGAPDEGWGAGWRKYTKEVNALKNPSKHRVWFVRDSRNSHGVWVMPGDGYPPLTGDGVPQSCFSNFDVGVRLFHEEEDSGWIFGARGDLGYLNGEGIQEQDVVFWYVAHLPHEAALGPAIWLAIGPTLKVHR